MGQIELVLAVWVTLASFVSAAEPPGGYYQTKLESLDVEDVLNHKRLVYYYSACLLSRGPCPPQGMDLKRILPESIETDCLRCTEKQKFIILTSIRRLRAEYPNIWKELVDFYDPTEAKLRSLEASIDKSLAGDEENYIGNRFGDSDSGNDLAAPVKPVSSVSPYIPPSTTTTTRKPTSSTKKPTTTTTIFAGSTAKPLSLSTSQKVGTTSSATTRPAYLTSWWITTDATKPSSYGWRPQPTLQTYNIPLLKLGLISDLGTRFLQAGSEVAGMVLSQVQQAFGQPAQ